MTEGIDEMPMIKIVNGIHSHTTADRGAGDHRRRGHHADVAAGPGRDGLLAAIGPCLACWMWR